MPNTSATRIPIPYKQTSTNISLSGKKAAQNKEYTGSLAPQDINGTRRAQRFFNPSPSNVLLA